MADSHAPPPAGGPDPSRGVAVELLSFFGSLGRHLQALVALAGTESREAAGLYLRVLLAAVAVLVVAVFGYVFLLLFVAFVLALVFAVNWIWICLGLAALHFLAGAIGAVYIKSHLQTPVFSATSAELKKDFEALNRLQP